MDLNLQVENAVSRFGSSAPTQGVIVKKYRPEGSWTAQGSGGLNHKASYGSYQYLRTGADTAQDRSFDMSAAGTMSVINYTFDSATGGKWVQDIRHGETILSGRFSMVRSNAPAEQQLAPATNAGLHVAIIIKSAVSSSLPPDAYPRKGLVLQSYASDGTLTFLGFGPGTLNSRGTYTYKKVSANTAVEETVQTSDYFTLPYTMVYTFKTPTSGSWFQNFGNGMILFSGTFDTFAR